MTDEDGTLVLDGTKADVINEAWTRPVEKEELFKEIEKLDGCISTLKFQLGILEKSRDSFMEIAKNWRDSRNKWKRYAILSLIGYAILSLIGVAIHRS